MVINLTDLQAGNKNIYENKCSLTGCTQQQNDHYYLFVFTPKNLFTMKQKKGFLIEKLLWKIL